jgi:hypothetical protein
MSPPQYYTEFVILSRLETYPMDESARELDLTIIFIDGIEFGKYTIIVALGDKEGKKTGLGKPGKTQQIIRRYEALMSNLIERDLQVDNLNTGGHRRLQGPA